MIAKEMEPDEMATSGDRMKAQSCLVTNGWTCRIEWDMQSHVPELWLVARAGGDRANGWRMMR